MNIKKTIAIWAINIVRICRTWTNLTILLFHDHLSLVLEECPQIQCATSLLSSFINSKNLKILNMDKTNGFSKASQ